MLKEYIDLLTSVLRLLVVLHNLLVVVLLLLEVSNNNKDNLKVDIKHKEEDMVVLILKLMANQ
jgi:hypothetical protein